nr:MAG TPA: hypothetical protein [Caudoviricetes sp.]
MPLFFSAAKNDGGSDYKKCQVHRFRQPTPLPLHRNLKVGDWDLEEKKGSLRTQKHRVATYSPL